MESHSFTLTFDKISYIFYDIFLLVGVYYIPTVSHLVSIPLYLFEPMRIMLFTLLLFFPNNKKNAVVMAATIPLFSFIMTGHPVMQKMMLMSFELVLNVILFQLFLKRLGVGISVFFSIVISKTAYYLIKAAIIYFGLLNMELVVTGLGTQIMVALVLSLVFHLVFKKRLK